MVTVTRQAAHRLADIEVEQHIVVDGVKLLRATSGRYFAESRSEPDRLWYLTGWSCGCPAFVYRQTCRHHRALMVALGWSSPEPTAPAPGFLTESVKESPTCPDCNGMGQVTGTVSSGKSWRYGDVVCPGCHGRGVAAAA